MTGTPVAAELILRGGSLYEPGTAAPQRADLAIAGGAIIGVGDVSCTAGQHTETVDVAGRLVLPGFTDAHIHPGAGQLEDLQCNLVGGTDADGHLAIIRGYADANPDIEWLTGGGWAEEHFCGNTPQPGELDTATGPRPAYLLNRDHHSAWVNTAALA
ncbi:MAG: amidohydrolase family protein, partial [Actinomycetota bacterium]|nr:amidohydrolase family protein [Actinomycetota bacterium]